MQWRGPWWRGWRRPGYETWSCAPVSRSGPLAVSFSRSTGIKTWVHLDERSAGFLHWALPRVREAGRGYDHLGDGGGELAACGSRGPADRGSPHSDNGRPTSRVGGLGGKPNIEQTGIYGAHVKWAADLPVPEADVRLTDYAWAIGRRAYATAAGYPSGPVHLNVPFREPLAPVGITGEEMEVSGVGGFWMASK